MLPLQTGFTPTFRSLLDVLWNFTVAWFWRYWYIPMIIVLLWYTRWYRVVLRSRGRGPQSATQALQLLLAHASALSTRGILLVAGFGLFLAGAIAWGLQSIGTLWFGAISFDPIIWANIAGIAAGILAAFGIDFVRPRIAVGIILGTLFLGYVVIFVAIQADELADD